MTKKQSTKMMLFILNTNIYQRLIKEEELLLCYNFITV